MTKTVTVIGTGYVGVTTAAILANAGYKVYAVDVSDDRLQALREGHSFFYEEGLDPLIAKAVKSGNLIPTLSYEESVPHSSFVFSCVGTPDNPDGSSNLTYIVAAAQETAKHIKSGSIYIQKSTVPVGTGRKVMEIFKSKNISYVSNPEFLREGTALLDTLYFDRIVVGGDDKEAVHKVLSLYRQVEKNREEIAKVGGITTKKTRSPQLDAVQGSKDTVNPAFPSATAFLGDYSNIAATPDGGVVAYWTDMRNDATFAGRTGHGEDAFFAKTS